MFALRSALVACGLVLAATAVCRADTMIPTVIPTIKGSPLKITACSVRMTPPGEGDLHNGYIPALAFTNTSKRVILAVEFAFQWHKVLEDPPFFGKVFYSYSSDKFEADPVPPGDGGTMRVTDWHIDLPKLRNVYCVPMRVAFVDGGFWYNPEYASIYK